VASVLVRNIETQRRGQGAQKAQQAEARAQQAEARAEGLQRQLAEAQEAATEAVRTMVSQNGWLLSRRGRSLPANAGGCDTHCASISSRLDTSSAGRRWRRRRRQRPAPPRTATRRVSAIRQRASPCRSVLIGLGQL
jgi:hypothetical protein